MHSRSLPPVLRPGTAVIFMSRSGQWEWQSALSVIAVVECSVRVMQRKIGLAYNYEFDHLEKKNHRHGQQQADLHHLIC